MRPFSKQSRNDVAVDDSRPVRARQGIGDLDPEPHNFAHRRAAAGITCDSVLPSTNSIAMQAWSPCPKMSKIVTMPGWLSDEAARASGVKRALASWLSARGTVFIEVSATDQATPHGLLRLVRAALTVDSARFVSETDLVALAPTRYGRPA
jgi:hypothetical protein